MEQPDSVLEENKWGYVVRSSRARTFIYEIMFCPSGVWFVDEWVPGETIRFEGKRATRG